MTATEQYYSLVVCLLCCTGWFQLSTTWMKSQSVPIQVNAIEQHWGALALDILQDHIYSFAWVLLELNEYRRNTVNEKQQTNT